MHTQAHVYTDIGTPHTHRQADGTWTSDARTGIRSHICSCSHMAVPFHTACAACSHLAVPAHGCHLPLQCTPECKDALIAIRDDIGCCWADLMAEAQNANVGGKKLPVDVVCPHGRSLHERLGASSSSLPLPFLFFTTPCPLHSPPASYATPSVPSTEISHPRSYLALCIAAFGRWCSVSSARRTP